MEHTEKKHVVVESLGETKQTTIKNRFVTVTQTIHNVKRRLLP